jgi:2-oxoglutarate dehydrogenase E1 component
LDVIKNIFLGLLDDLFSLFILETSFKRIYPEEGPPSDNPADVRKIIFCSGKTYYDLFNERKNNKLDSQIAIVRIEQLCPFPFDLIRTELEKYKNAKLCFAQEEHKNMGPVRIFSPLNRSSISNFIYLVYLL